MAISSHRVTLSTTPALIGSEKTRILIVLIGTGDGYLGGPDVSPTNGYGFARFVEREFVLERGEFLYAVLDPGVSGTVSILTRE